VSGNGSSCRSDKLKSFPRPSQAKIVRATDADPMPDYENALTD
jgi:hypothetical protein